jgi:hypothetical protein
MFSEIKKGMHMGIVVAAESRAEARELYLPPHERGMAHRSYLSPDKKWVLLAEMDNQGWLPCRLLPFDGSSSGRSVGRPEAACTEAAWSPDGKWMYFTSLAGGTFHIWRQRFPDGAPEQVTSGPTEEQGIAMAPDGRSVVTSVGTRQSTAWVADARGERQVSFEGFAGFPGAGIGTQRERLFSRWEETLLHPAGCGPGMDRRRAVGNDLESGASNRILPGFLVTGYDLAPDGKRLVFASLDKRGQSRLWLASLDRRFAPRQLPPVQADSPLFFRQTEGQFNYVYRMKDDGRGIEKASPDPILYLQSVSLDGRWVCANVSIQEEDSSIATVFLPVGGGNPQRLCYQCVWRFVRNGKLAFLTLSRGAFSPQTMVGRGERWMETVVIQLGPGGKLPPLPATGIRTEADTARLPRVRILNAPWAFPGPEGTSYAFTKESVQRNLYRIPIR